MSTKSKHVAKIQPTPEHGTYSTYVNWGCRCEACKEANAEKSRRERARRKAELEAA